MKRIEPEELVGEEWAAWYRLSPMQRLEKSAQLWERYEAAGGSLAPHFDPKSPFHQDYLAFDVYEKHSIPEDLVREDVDFESLIAACRAADSLEHAQEIIRAFREKLDLIA